MAAPQVQKPQAPPQPKIEQRQSERHHHHDRHHHHHDRSHRSHHDQRSRDSYQGNTILEFSILLQKRKMGTFTFYYPNEVLSWKIRSFTNGTIIGQGQSSRDPRPHRSQERPKSEKPQDMEKMALIQQVLQLTPDQINMLPEDQKRSILSLKEQLKSQGRS